MKIRARTLVVLGLVLGGVLAVLVEVVIVERLTYTRDLQLSLVENLEQQMVLERALHNGLIGVAEYEPIPSPLLDELLAAPIPGDCCITEHLALLQSLVVDDLVTRADAHTAANASTLLAAVKRHTAAQKANLKGFYGENTVIPLLWGGAVLVALFVLWAGYRFGVVRPLERLKIAVEESRFGGFFVFSDNHFAPEEITSLARSFKALVGELERALEAKSEEFHVYQSNARVVAERGALELARLFDKSSAPIFMLGLDGTITSWNHKVAELTQYPADIAVGRMFDAIFLDASNRERFLSSFALSIEGTPQDDLRLSLSTTRARRVQLLISLSPQTDVAGDISGVICVGHALEELLESTQRAVEVQRALHFSELASGAAHQLNQPLQKMRLLLANANNRLRLPDIDREVVAAKVKGADEQLSRLAEIVDHLRIFGQRVEPVSGGFDLGIIVERCVDLARSSFNERGIRLVLHNDLKDQKVQGHPVQIERTLIALLDNARDAVLEKAPKLPKVEVSAEVAADGNVVIIIADNGGGIDETVMPKVFDPFFTTKINAKNTGLGLAEVAGLINELNGRIALVNTDTGIAASVSIPIIMELAEC